MTIKAGDRIPEGKLKIMGADGPLNVTAAELLGKGRVVLFSVPGAFTPTCSAKHLPGFVEKATALQGKGVAKIVCLAVNDVFVMNAWGKSAGVGDAIVMAADGNGDYARALGLELDARGFGMGMRGQRFALVIEDGSRQAGPCRGAGRVQGVERRARARVALGRPRGHRAGLFLYAGLLGLLLIALSTQVVLARRHFRVRLGTGTEEGMQQAVRVQANFVEYVPFAVLLLVLAEDLGTSGVGRARRGRPAGREPAPARGRPVAEPRPQLWPPLRDGWHLAHDRRAFAVAPVRDYSSFSISGTRVKRSPTSP